MPQNYCRAERVSGSLHREVALLLRHEVKDPRLQQLTITEVSVSNDLSFARIYFTVIDSEQVPEVLSILNRATGFLRKQLGHKLKLRLVPELKFIYDSSVEQGQQISDLIEQAVKADEALKRDEKE